MEVLTILVTGALCCVCFFIGAKVGQKVSKGETLELPSANPLQAVKEHQAKKEAEMEQHRLDTIMKNLERYDGTAFGQEDVG
jgi:hypothetical protein